MQPPRFSIVIPARNEEKFIGRCISAIRAAQREFALEIIVVINRCTDRTEQIASDNGCIITHNESKNLSQIRNCGAKSARGEILITIDADSVMSTNALTRIDELMRSGSYIGGGVAIFPERYSLGIIVTAMLLAPIALYHGISAGLFFCMREDFIAIGGFNETLLSAEDIDFAKRLKQHGKRSRKRFTTCFSAYIITSCRKFDKLGDWFFVTHIGDSLRLLKGQDQDLANRVWYDLDR